MEKENTQSGQTDQEAIVQSSPKVLVTLDKLTIQVKREDFLDENIIRPGNLKLPNGFQPFLGIKNQGHDISITFNPSHHLDYQKSLNHLKQIIRPESFSKAKISRVDLALTFNTDFLDVIRYLNFHGKHACRIYQNIKRGVRSLCVGKDKKTFSIVIYDKALQMKSKGVKPTSEPLTRMEFQRYPLPPNTNLGNLLEEVMKAGPFNHLEELTIHFDESKEDGRFFKKLIHKTGYFAARQILNEHGNFDRNYGHCYEVIASSKAPYGNLFSKGIIPFLQGE